MTNNFPHYSEVSTIVPCPRCKQYRCLNDDYDCKPNGERYKVCNVCLEKQNRNKEASGSNIDKRYCKRCQATKNLDLFYEDKKYCIRCLEKEREKYYRNREKKLQYAQTYYVEHKEEKTEYKKAYNQIEIHCEVCECKVKKCRWSRHILTQKHIDNLESKIETLTR